MERRKSYVIVALFGLLLLTEIVIAESDGGKGNGNNGKGNEGKVEKRKGGDDGQGQRTKTRTRMTRKDKEQSGAAASRYRMLSPLPTGQEQAMCQGQGACYYKNFVCPGECPKRKPTKNKSTKGCFIDCTSKCDATCKFPPKTGVPRPVMGGEDKYQTPSLFSPTLQV
ncbi:hypothetical protein Bca52824_051431 [Brassica carinata]|uniref:Uncharacterized protein n=1 Tax=Brassica carinata TaxID=52824 RepID=A0A8X7R1P9_BRACI|nr:hypothetical protein Bca52824_051431 [Brassica carinata]